MSRYHGNTENTCVLRLVAGARSVADFIVASVGWRQLSGKRLFAATQHRRTDTHTHTQSPLSVSNIRRCYECFADSVIASARRSNLSFSSRQELTCIAIQVGRSLFKCNETTVNST
jgi:hypothetical protein